MSQATETPTAIALTDETPTRKPINYRKALAGLRFARGEGSLAHCLVKSGYSRSTSRVQMRNGLSADLCLAEAEKLAPDLSPAKLLETGRRTLLTTVALTPPELVSIRDATRLLDVTEKYFGAHQTPALPAGFAVADRLTSIIALALVIQERSPGAPLPIEAKAIEKPTIDFVDATIKVETAP